MDSHLGIVLAVTALLVLLAQVPQAPAACCKYQTVHWRGNRFIYRCADCSEIRSYYCGVPGGGGCNLFGCNCGGGCIKAVPGRVCDEDCCDDRKDRHDHKSRREVTSAAISLPSGNFTGFDIVNDGDLDKNGHLDEIEVHLYLTQRGVLVDDVTAWRQLDSNDDGKLTAAEIDNDLRSTDDVAVV